MSKSRANLLSPLTAFAVLVVLTVAGIGRCSAEVSITCTNPSLSGSSGSVPLGTQAVLIATGVPPSAKLIWSSSEPDVVSIDDSGKITAKAPGSNVVITATSETDIAMSGTYTLSVSSPSVNLVGPSGVIYVGDSITEQDLRLSKNGMPVDLNDVVWNVSPPNIAFANGKLPGTAINPGTCTLYAKVTIQNATNPVISNAVPVTVSANVLVIDLPSELPVGTSKTASVTLNGKDVSRDPNLKWHLSTNATDCAAPISISSNTPGLLTVLASYSKNNAIVVAAHTEVTIYQPTSKIIINAPAEMKTGSAASVTAVTEDANGNIIPRPVTWSVDPATASVAQFLPNSNSLVANSEGVARIVATSDSLSQAATIKVISVPQIKTISARLSRIQPITVQQDFGRAIDDQFFCYDVTLKNVLSENDEPSFDNKAILAFSDSIVTHVYMEKKWSGAGPDPTGHGGWSIVTNADYERYGVPPDPAVNGSELALPSAAGETASDPHIFLFQPYREALLSGGQASRSANNPRAILFGIIGGIATVASFATATNILRGSAPQVLDKFTNLLIPGLESRIPDLQPTQEQNLLNDVMNDVETVAFNRSMTKTVFFPKAPMTGYLSGFQTRISSVIPTYFAVRVAVVTEMNSTGNVAASNTDSAR